MCALFPSHLLLHPSQKLLASVENSEEVGNVQLDALSSQKYYHFIRLMGRAASNIALECALQTRPNVCFISEEVEAKAMSLKQVRHALGENIVHALPIA